MTSMFDEGCFVHERISSTGLDVCSSTVEGIKYEVLDGNGTTTELPQTEAMRVLEPWGWRRVGGAFRGSISVNEFGAVSVVEVGSGGEKGKPTQLSIPAGFEITSQCCKEESFEVGYEERDDVFKEQFDKGVREVGVVPEDGETFTGPGCMRNINSLLIIEEFGRRLETSEFEGEAIVLALIRR
ncbi:hypothetical protein NC653_030684 [Populus alba x Populus x berolinensis]|uniref:Uncharacterized protein n=1 Tax=Populus alba x Populus x berolinensis TaxID=444605 RepID=A0AAD6Q0H3_9ROSI|nr:hypothetical protein NC653_030684 [Populus alba x Populus x berolinensis]